MEHHDDLTFISDRNCFLLKLRDLLIYHSDTIVIIADNRGYAPPHLLITVGSQECNNIEKLTPKDIGEYFSNLNKTEGN